MVAKSGLLMWSKCVKNVKHVSWSTKDLNMFHFTHVRVLKVLEDALFGLCLTFPEQHVHDCGQCLFKVVGSVLDAADI